MLYYVKWSAPSRFYPAKPVQLAFGIRVVGWDPRVPLTRVFYDAVIEACNKDAVWQIIESTITGPTQGKTERIVVRPDGEEQPPSALKAWQKGELLPTSIEVVNGEKDDLKVIYDQIPK